MAKLLSFLSLKIFKITLSVFTIIISFLSLICFIVSFDNSISFINLLSSSFNGFWLVPLAPSHIAFNYSSISLYLTFQNFIVFLLISLITFIGVFINKTDEDFFARLSLIAGNIISLAFYHTHKDFAAANKYPQYGLAIIIVCGILLIVFIFFFIINRIFIDFDIKKKLLELGFYALIWSIAAVILLGLSQNNIDTMSLMKLIGLFFYIVPYYFVINVSFGIGFIFDSCATSYSICFMLLYALILTILLISQIIKKKKKIKTID